MNDYQRSQQYMGRGDSNQRRDAAARRWRPMTLTPAERLRRMPRHAQLARLICALAEPGKVAASLERVQ